MKPHIEWVKHYSTGKMVRLKKAPSYVLNKVTCVPFGKNMYFLHADLHLRGIDIMSHSGDEEKDSIAVSFEYPCGECYITASINFTDLKGVRYSWFDGVASDTYTGVLMPSKVITRAINKLNKIT